MRLWPTVTRSPPSLLSMTRTEISSRPTRFPRPRLRRRSKTSAETGPCIGRREVTYTVSGDTAPHDWSGTRSLQRKSIERPTRPPVLSACAPVCAENTFLLPNEPTWSLPDASVQPRPRLGLTLTLDPRTTPIAPLSCGHS